MLASASATQPPGYNTISEHFTRRSDRDSWGRGWAARECPGDPLPGWHAPCGPPPPEEWVSIPHTDGRECSAMRDANFSYRCMSRRSAEVLNLGPKREFRGCPTARSSHAPPHYIVVRLSPARCYPRSCSTDTLDRSPSRRGRAASSTDSRVRRRFTRISNTASTPGSRRRRTSSTSFFRRAGIGDCERPWLPTPTPAFESLRRSATSCVVPMRRTRCYRR